MKKEDQRPAGEKVELLLKRISQTTDPKKKRMLEDLLPVVKARSKSWIFNQYKV